MSIGRMMGIFTSYPHRSWSMLGESVRSGEMKKPERAHNLFGSLPLPPGQAFCLRPLAPINFDVVLSPLGWACMPDFDGERIRKNWTRASHEFCLACCSLWWPACRALQWRYGSRSAVGAGSLGPPARLTSSTRRGGGIPLPRLAPPSPCSRAHCVAL
jgi:hypothetical protein